MAYFAVTVVLGTAPPVCFRFSYLSLDTFSSRLAIKKREKFRDIDLCHASKFRDIDRFLCHARQFRDIDLCHANKARDIDSVLWHTVTRKIQGKTHLLEK